MTDTINNLFEKLKDYEKREFLIKNIMKDKFFDKYHKTFDSDFITFIYSKEEQEQKIKQRDNNLFVNNFIDTLNDYKNSIHELLSQQSRYKDFYCYVADNIEQIEKVAKSDKINYVNNENISIVKLILEFYDDNSGLIEELEQDAIKMNKTIKLLLKNKNMDKKFIEEYDHIFEEYK